MDIPNLTCNEPDTVCIHDIEAYIILLTSLYSHRLTTPSHQLYSVSQSPVPPLKLNAALCMLLPSSLSIVTKHLSLWTALIKFFGKKLSIQDAVAVKKLVREFLMFVRGSTPLQLNLEQLTLLARHFKERAEEIAEDAAAGDKDAITSLLKWSSHYWTIIVTILTSDTTPENQAVHGSPSSPVAKDNNNTFLLTEARMALANEALFKQDTAKALRLYSRVKTPHAAWNQSQIYLHIANLHGQTDTPDKLDTRILNLQKALDTIELAVVRLSPSENSTLQKRLLSQRDVVRSLLGDAKKSPLVACTLKYEDESPLIPCRSSTPAWKNTDTRLSEDTSQTSVDHSLLNTSPTKSISQRDEQLSAMARQLEQLQAEMEKIKKQTVLAHGTSFSSSLPNNLYVPSPSSHFASPNLSTANRSPVKFLGGSTHTVYGHSPQPLGSGLASEPSSIVGGSLAVVRGSSPVACSPLLSTHEASHSSLQEMSNSFSQYQGVVFTTQNVEVTSPFSPNVPPHMPFVSKQSAFFSASALPSFPQLQFSPQNVPSPPKGLSLPQHLQSRAIFDLTKLTSEQPIPGNQDAPPISTFPALTSSTSRLPEFKPMFTLSSLPVFQPAFSSTDVLSEVPITTAGNQPPFSSAHLQSAAPMFRSPLTTITYSSVTLPSVSSAQSSVHPITGSGVQPSTKPLFNFTATFSPQDIPPTLTTTYESTPVQRKILKVKELPKSVSSGLVFQTSVVDSIPTTETPATIVGDNTLAVIPPFSSTPSSISGGSNMAFTVRNTQPLSLTTAQVTTVGMAVSTSQLFFQPKQPATVSFTNPSLSKFQDVKSSLGSTQAQDLSSTFPMLSSLLSNKSVSDTQSLSSSSGNGPISFSSTPTFVFSMQPVKTSSSTTSIPSFTFGGLTSSDVKITETDEPDAAVISKDQESLVDTSEGGPDFVPIVTLPELANVFSGEENEKVLFEHRAKLYRFCNAEWKERGLGDMKILKHNTTRKVRLLMRREQILKLCCNHYLIPGMSLTYVKGSNRMLAWCATANLVEGETRDEKLAVKFKNETIATEFKAVFEKCVLEVEQRSDQSESVIYSKKKVPVKDSEQLHPPCTDIHSKLVSPQSPGSWACNVCLITNERESSKCIACSSLKPLSSANRSSTVLPVTTISFPPNSPGSWTCDVCLLLNKQDSDKCVACSTLKPPTTVHTLPLTSVARSSAVSVCKSTSSIPSTNTVSSGGFLLASGALKAATILKYSADGSSGAMPGLLSGGFKLSPGTLKATASQTGNPVSTSFGISSVNTPTASSESPVITSVVPSSVQPLFSPSNTLASSTFKIKTKPLFFDSEFPNLSDAYSSVFSSHEEKETEAEAAGQDYEPDVYFKPVVSLPDAVDVYTGEEGSEVLFSHRGKLYRFDSKVSVWKERGIGEVKILKSEQNNKVRIVMRREQVKKLCCNHYLVPGMILSPLSNSDTAWTWYTVSDFADGVSKPEKLAIKFKYVETAQHFKRVFEECVKSLSTEERISDVSDGDSKNADDDVIITCIEMPSPEKVALAEKLKLPGTFFNYETKPACPGCRGCIESPVDQTDLNIADSTADHHSPSSVLSKVTDRTDRDSGECVKTEVIAVFPHKNSSKPLTGLFSNSSAVSFSDLATGDSSFLFGSKGNTKSPGFARAGEVLFSSKVSATDAEEDPESEVNIDFKPVVTLPEIELVTGEESDEPLFSHRAKLYRFDSVLKQWKERGVGDIKIVKNIHTDKARIVMRRDQIRKVCCNHVIFTDMNLTPNQGSDKSWVWYTPCDFSDEEARPEKLAVKFKFADKAAQFKTIFDKCKTFIPRKSAVSSENNAMHDVVQDESRIGSQENCDVSSLSHSFGSKVGQKFAPPLDSWTCNVCLVQNNQANSACVSCGTQLVSDQPRERIPSAVADSKKGKLLSPDSSTNRNPFLRFPLDMSPDVTRQPFAHSGSPSGLYSTQISSDVDNEDMPKLETLSGDEHERESEHDITESDLKCEDVDPPICQAHKGSQDVDIQGGDSEDNGEIESSEVRGSVPVLTSDCDSNLHATITLNEACNEESDVVFLYEELPDDSLVLKAKELMLPPSFFMYEKKPPCPGCRGCGDDLGDSLVLSDVSSKHEGVIKSTSDSLIDSEPEKNVGKDCISKKFSSDISSANESSSYFTKPGLLSFSDLAPSTIAGFAQSTPGFQFRGAGKQLFSTTTSVGDDDPESEVDINFKPIVSLPQVTPMKSWDNDAEQLFASRAKLYRFDTTLNQWKERGVGDMKIFRHKETGRVRMIMRRDQILKICCNHYIIAGMNLVPGTNEKSWVWFTNSDLSDDEPKSEKFAIRFKHVETAQKFKKIFDECVSHVPDTDSNFVSELLENDLLAKTSDSQWSCSVCLVVNKLTNTACVACQTPNKVASSSVQTEALADVQQIPSIESLVEVRSMPISQHSEGTGGFKLPRSLVQLTQQETSTPVEFQAINLSVMKFGTPSIPGSVKKSTDKDYCEDDEMATNETTSDDQIVNAGDKSAGGANI